MSYSKAHLYKTKPRDYPLGSGPVLETLTWRVKVLLCGHKWYDASREILEICLMNCIEMTNVSFITDF